MLLTSIRDSPAAPRVALHTSADALAHTARRTSPPIRLVSMLSDSDADANPPPSTVSGVPPSDSATVGEIELTDAAAWYVYDAPLRAYCCQFIESSTPALPAECTADEHSRSIYSLTCHRTM